MKRILLLFISAAALAACHIKSGSGNIITEKRNTGSFDGINVGGGFEVEVSQGNNREVTVEADDNLIKYVITDVENGKLKIRLDDINARHAHLKVYVTSPEISFIKASAGAEVKTRDVIRSGNSIQLNASSGSQVNAAVDAPNIDADASSGSEVNLSGKTRTVSLDASSGSQINADELQSETAQAHASSGASASIHASVKLDAKASSGGHVSYKGGAVVNKVESSGGEVSRVGE